MLNLLGILFMLIASRFCIDGGSYWLGGDKEVAWRGIEGVNISLLVGWAGITRRSARVRNPIPRCRGTGDVMSIYSPSTSEDCQSP